MNIENIDSKLTNFLDILLYKNQHVNIIGYSKNLSKNNIINNYNITFLQKPFRFNVLLEKIYNIKSTKKEVNKINLMKNIEFSPNKKTLFNPKTKIKSYKIRLNKKNFNNIVNQYEYIVDATDNFKTKYLINDFCKISNKFLVTGAISKFDGHIFTFDFKNKKTPCIRSFFQEDQIPDDILNCEYEGVLGTVAGIVGTIQANEILKKILNIGKNLNGHVLILDLLNLNFRKVKFDK